MVTWAKNEWNMGYLELISSDTEEENWIMCFKGIFGRVLIDTLAQHLDRYSINIPIDFFFFNQ